MFLLILGIYISHFTVIWFWRYKMWFCWWNFCRW